jgi:hypothetical protein
MQRRPTAASEGAHYPSVVISTQPLSDNLLVAIPITPWWQPLPNPISLLGGNWLVASRRQPQRARTWKREALPAISLIAPM